MPASSAARWNSTAPYTPLVSVQASAEKPLEEAAAIMTSGLEAPWPMENQEWAWRWVNTP